MIKQAVFTECTAGRSVPVRSMCPAMAVGRRSVGRSLGDLTRGHAGQSGDGVKMTEGRASHWPTGTDHDINCRVQREKQHESEKNNMRARKTGESEIINER